jgi:threonine/homoserine/homoserine lactone efflux protein
LIFVLGPCEPLMPLFLVPASQGRWTLAGAMALVFAVATLGTMLAMTALALRGLERLPLAPLERWMHVLCGAVVTLSGVAVLLGA